MCGKRYIPMPCGGKGNCGKCRIRIIKGEILPNERDRKFLSEEEIKNGVRIACGHNIPEETEFDFIEDVFETAVCVFENGEEEYCIKESKETAVIIDVGTTTLCFALVDKSGKEIKNLAMPNSQRAFGADVISRISKASAGGGAQLADILKNDLKKGIEKLLENVKERVSQVFIAGNTVMTYFLRNMDCRPLGVYPFENNAKDVFRQDSYLFFDKNPPKSLKENTEVIIIPCIDAFVGGDIVSGAFFLDIDKKEDCLFIDIGTNGEMLLNAKGELFCASAAAGPAFEGGEISCGLAAVSGAISSVFMENGGMKYTVIGNKKPQGICSAAIIDMLALLKESEIIDGGGLLEDKYFSKGFKLTEGIFITQKDIRAIQLAKSAIMSGIECILSYAGMKFDDVREVFIGGGFGFYLNCENAFKIKMLPKEFRGKIRVCGNTVLGGLAKIYKTGFSDYDKFTENTELVEFAGSEEFQKAFIDNLNF